MKLQVKILSCDAGAGSQDLSGHRLEGCMVLSRWERKGRKCGRRVAGGVYGGASPVSGKLGQQ